MFRRNDDVKEQLLAEILDKLDKRDASDRPVPQPTYTVTQILTGAVAAIMLCSGFVGTWVTFSSRIAAQEVNYNLTIEQLKKDVAKTDDETKSVRSEIQATKDTIQASLDKLTNRIGELDSTVNQLYNSRGK